MASPDYELQKAIYDRLMGYAPLSAIVGVKVYDKPPAEALEPYVTIGHSDVHRVDVTCKKASKIFTQVHGWSTSVGFPEVKNIADAVAEALHDYPLVLGTHRLVSNEHFKTLTIREPDGLTNHTVIEFVAYVEKR